MARKHYPTICLSAYCPKSGDDCLTCEHYSDLQEFKAWVKAHEAYRPDPIWSPTVYVSTTA